MRKSALPLFFVLAIILPILTACSSPTPSTPTPGPEGVLFIEPPAPLTDFTLTNQANQEFHLHDLNGKLTLVTFGYTNCPDVCPITLAQFKQIKEALGEDAEQVQFVFVSVDGARDTPERLTEYLTAFDATFIGLTGSEAVVRPVIEEVKGGFVLNNAGGLRKAYTVEHTAGAFLLDRQGNWTRRYAYAAPIEVVAEDIRRALRS